jgi:YegS/Rv2252/BmrU family lipid kinase
VTTYQRPAIILNPSKCEDSDRFRAEVDETFKERGLAPARWIETTAEDPGRWQSALAVRDGADLVLAAGGDGTVRACVDTLVGGSVPLGLLPLGTGNLLARNLDVPLTLDAAVAVITEGGLRLIDVAELDGEVFAVMGGGGFDAKLFSFTSDRLKSRLGWAAYVVAGVRALRRSRPGHIDVTVDDIHNSLPGVGVLVGNVGMLTGGLQLLPAARPDDGLLDVAVLTPTTAADWAGLAARVIAGRRPQPWQLQHLTGRLIQVSFASTMPVEVDGDLLDPRSAFTIRVRPHALTVCTPLRG